MTLSRVVISDCSQGEYYNDRSGADGVTSSLGNSETVSSDIISDVENAMRQAFPQVSLLPTTAPWLLGDHINSGCNPVSGTSTSLCPLRTYSRAPPFGTPGLSGAHSPSILSPDFQVPIFQLTRPRQPLVSSDSSYVKREDSVSSLPTDGPQVDLEFSPSPSHATSSSSSCCVGSSVSGVSSTGALRSETLNGSPLGPAASSTERVYGQEEPFVNVCGSSLREEPRPAPACSLVPGDYQAFQSVARGPEELIPEASDDGPDKLSETLFTAMPSMMSPLATCHQGAQGHLEPQANRRFLF